MKKIIFLFAALIIHTIILTAQTLIVPGGTAGIGNNTTNGNVGIGTTNPANALDINGSVNLNNQYGSSTDYINPGYYVYKSGTVAYGMKLQYTGGKYGTMIFGSNQSDRFIGFGKVGDELKDSKMIEFMRIDLNNGNVGIGTTSPQNKLDVNGTIRAKEIVATMSNWPDYVFDKEYKLKPLNEVECFIKENNRLPEIPSAVAVSADGVKLSEMNALLLKKVEELTLYVIELNKKIEKLESSKNSK